MQNAVTSPIGTVVRVGIEPSGPGHYRTWEHHEIALRIEMRKFLAVTAILLIVSAAPNARADDATNLYRALLSKQLEQMPEGFSSATLGSMPLNPAWQRAGMVGIAKITLAGKDTSGQVRYAVFSTKQDFEAYVREFSMPGNPIFFPYFPEAKCTSHGNQQAC